MARTVISLVDVGPRDPWTIVEPSGVILPGAIQTRDKGEDRVQTYAALPDACGGSDQLPRREGDHLIAQMNPSKRKRRRPDATQRRRKRRKEREKVVGAIVSAVGQSSSKKRRERRRKCRMRCDTNSGGKWGAGPIELDVVLGPWRVGGSCVM